MEQDIIREIELLREKMVKTAMEFGIKHPLVLLLSKRIDKLHTELTKINLTKSYIKKKVENDNFFETNCDQIYA